MSENESLLSQLQQMLVWKKSKKFYAEKLGITEAEVEDLLKELKNESEEQGERSKRVNVDKGTIESNIELDYEPKSDIDLARLHKIDLKKYKISNYWSKLKSNGKFTSSVLASLKKPKDYTAEDFANFLDGYKSTYKPSSKKVVVLPTSVDVEISVADFHLAKKTIDGENCIINRKNAFLNVVKNLVEKVKGNFHIDRIVFPISNDFFHTDNYQNSTTNGTPQDVIVGFDSEYEEGFDLLVNAISYLRDNCDALKVVLVQGNHDRTKSFYLAHALEVYFKNDESITFDRKHSVTKSVVLGTTFIGYHHGNCKIEDLPLLFATSPDTSGDFGLATYREVHTGDKHHYMAKEVKGVRIQQMPSLSGTDRWHSDNLYVNQIRAGLAFVYDNIDGKIAEFEERIKY